MSFLTAARLVSYDNIDAILLEEIRTVEKTSSVKAMTQLERDDEEDAKPLTPSPAVPAAPVILPAQPKKALRTGRKKVVISTTGDIALATPVTRQSSGSNHSSAGSVTVETLDQIMIELERAEAEKAVQEDRNRQREREAKRQQKGQPQITKSPIVDEEKAPPKFRYFCCC